MNNSVLIRAFGFFAFVLIVGTSAAQSQTGHTAPPAATVKGPHVAPPAVTYPKGAHIEASQYDCGNPTDEEQYIIELINRARANPAAEGDRLSTTQDAGIVNNLRSYSEPTRAQIKQEFSTY